MADKDSGGQKANKTGNRLELFVEQTLVEKGYAEFWNHKLSAFENRKAIGGKQYLKQIPVGTTIYNTTRKCDFLVINGELFPEGLIIECKWQQKRGSVDEKYPLLLFNIMKTGVPTIILLDGAGYRKEAMAWLKKQAQPERALFAVLDMAEFHKRVNDGLLG